MKNKRTPRCALCAQRRPLRKSHIIPKFIYQVVRRNQPYKQEHEKVPVVVSNESKTIQKDVRQYKIPLLCECCEGLFSAKETLMASMISSLPQGITNKDFMGYGGADLFNVVSANMTCFFTPEKISAMKYFFLSCVFRQVVAEKRSINKIFLKGLKRYLLGGSAIFGVNLLFKVNNGESHPMATSISLCSDRTYTHGLILIPEFLMHLIITECKPVLDEDTILVTPEDFELDVQINKLCRMNVGDYKVSSSFQAYLDRLK